MAPVAWPQIVLDGARAVQNFTPAELAGQHIPIGLWGYSGGGLAPAWAAELQSAYAPELNIVGSAEGGVPADFRDLVAANSGSSAFGLMFAAAVGLSRQYPEMDLDGLLNDTGRRLREAISAQCVSGVLQTGSGPSFDRVTTRPDAINTPGVRGAIEHNTPGGTAPKAPVLLYHSLADAAVPTRKADALFGRYCQLHATVQYEHSPFTDHVLPAIMSLPSVLGFFDGRFAGAPPVSTC